MKRKAQTWSKTKLPGPKKLIEYFDFVLIYLFIYLFIYFTQLVVHDQLAWHAKCERGVIANHGKKRKERNIEKEKKEG